MRIRPLGDQRHHARDAQLRGLLDRPLHAVELEDRQQQRDVGERGCRQFLAEFKLDFLRRDGNDAAAPHPPLGRDIEFLADARPQNAGEVLGLGADQRSAAARDFVGDPAAARH